jgi:hypothetical protein
MLGLVKEREAAFQRYLGEAEAHFAGVNNFEARKPRMVKVYADLDASQRASIDAASRILDFAEANLGRAKAEYGQYVMGTEVQVTQYNELARRMQQAIANEQAALQQFAAFQQETRGN